MKHANHSTNMIPQNLFWSHIATHLVTNPTIPFLF